MPKQKDPPEIPKVMIPVVAEYLAKLRTWMIANRPVAGKNMNQTDAAGGGIKLDAAAGGKSVPSLWFFNGAVRVLNVKVDE